MNLGLENKCAMVVASSKGLGKAIAMELAKEGCNLALCSSNIKNLEKTANEIKAQTDKIIFYQKCDIRIPKEIELFCKNSLKELGKIDILILNAGGPKAGDFFRVSLEDWEEAYKLNLRSAIAFCQQILPNMIERKWGRIIFLTSISVKQPLGNLILSNSIRLAIIGLAKSLSNEFSKYGILINSVCPGFTKTERLIELAGYLSKEKNKGIEDIFKDWEKDIPMGRLGEPEELASVVAFLSSEKASYITGAALQVDGGYIKFIY